MSSKNTSGPVTSETQVLAVPPADSAELAKLREAHGSLDNELRSAREEHALAASKAESELTAVKSEADTLREQLRAALSDRDEAAAKLDDTRALLAQREGEEGPPVIGATSNTASPSFADLPADHPLKTDLPVRVGEPIGDPLVSQAPGSPVANR